MRRLRSATECSFFFLPWVVHNVRRVLQSFNLVTQQMKLLSAPSKAVLRPSRGGGAKGGSVSMPVVGSERVGGRRGADG